MIDSKFLCYINTVWIDIIELIMVCPLANSSFLAMEHVRSDPKCVLHRQRGICQKPNNVCNKRSTWPSSLLKTVDLEYRRGFRLLVSCSQTLTGISVWWANHCSNTYSDCVGTKPLRSQYFYYAAIIVMSSRRSTHTRQAAIIAKQCNYLCSAQLTCHPPQLGWVLEQV